jgi:(p)ppGpp synthase/HD superfamily hydrolase
MAPGHPGSKARGRTDMTLEQAISLAAQVHEGQLDKAGEAYILHPLRVMLRLETVEERRVAVLHDVVEDSGVTLDTLRRKGLPEQEVLAVAALTKGEGETYDAFIERAGRNGLARRVKLADLEDNSDRSRLKVIGPREEERLAKYRRAKERLQAIL